MLKIDKNILDNKRNIHFIGIGGSGMYPLVQILHGQGYNITGSDVNTGTNIDSEIAMGIKVFMGHKTENIYGCDIIVFSAAIAHDNVELLEAEKLGIPTVERSEMLGLVTSWFENAICISGTHGKTTTTSMITQILLNCGKDPSAVIGGNLPVINGNGRHGESENMVCEACEFMDTFLHLSPDIAVILNIDEDHMDYFKTMDNMILSYKKFAMLATKSVIINGDDANTQKAVSEVKTPIITYGIKDTNDYYAKNIKIEGISSSYELYHKEEKLTDIKLNVPGLHNVSNSVCAAVAAILSGVEIKEIAPAILNFKGAGRRFELLGEINGITIIDDFAHHPAEIEVTLKAAKGLGYNNVWAVFQPYTYSRTALLLNDFVKSLSLADKVVMTEIVSAREENIYNIYTKDLAEKIQNSTWFNSFEEIANYVLTNAKKGDLVITMGGGDIYKCAHLMVKNK